MVLNFVEEDIIRLSIRFFFFRSGWEKDVVLRLMQVRIDFCRDKLILLEFGKLLLFFVFLQQGRYLFEKKELRLCVCYCLFLRCLHTWCVIIFEISLLLVRSKLMYAIKYFKYMEDIKRCLRHDYSCRINIWNILRCTMRFIDHNQRKVAQAKNELFFFFFFIN